MPAMVEEVRNVTKIGRLRYPTQLPIHGQWWSNLQTTVDRLRHEKRR
jgi:hypothetical protein